MHSNIRYWTYLLLLALQYQEFGQSLEVTVEPSDGCVCPGQNYTCRAGLITGLNWVTAANPGDPVAYTIANPSRSKDISRNGIRYFFSDKISGDGIANITSGLFITNIKRNKTNVSCEAFFSNDGTVKINVTVCVVGPASAPTDLSVVWDPPSAVVSFQSPVYGGECVDHYIVTATSEKENVSCDATTRDELVYNCIIPSDRNVNEFNFTAYPVTRGVDGVFYDGITSTECRLLFPENLRAAEKECGLQQLVNVSWERIRRLQMNETIFVSGEAISYERALSEDSHLLTLNYSESGPVEIAVTFSSPVCRKTTVTHYLVEEILRNVSLNSTTLVIESRDCIGSRENYRIVVTSTDTPSTELVNASFSPTIEHDVGDVVRPNTQYTIRVQLVETTSGTTINEITTTIMYTSPTAAPSSEPGVTTTTTVQPTTDGDVATFVAVGVAVGVLVGLVVGAVVAVFVMVAVMRKKLGDSVRGTGFSSSKETEMSAVNQSQGVVYETVGGVGATTGPATSENVAYGVPDTVPTSHNPAYSHLPTKK